MRRRSGGTDPDRPVVRERGLHPYRASRPVRAPGGTGNPANLARVQYSERVQDLRNANKRRRRQQILQGAHDLIARDGVGALTMRSLAEESGVSVPTIYALVGGRHDVISALIDSGVHRFDAGVDALGSRGLFRATAIVELFADILEDERALLHALLGSGALVSSGSEPLLLFHRRQVELERAFREAVEDGELRAEVDPVFAATTTVRLGMGVLIDWVVGSGDPAELRTELLRSVSVVIAAFA